MNVKNDLTAGLIADILSRGMSLTGFDLKDGVNMAALSALNEIGCALQGNTKDNEKLAKIEKIMDSYNLKER